MIVGFANGCFDLLHEGHLHLLREARKQCDKLIIGLNSDVSVRRLKGPGRPVQNVRARTLALMDSGLISSVRIFNSEADLNSLINTLRPDIIFKGADYLGRMVAGMTDAKVVFVPFLEGYSTTSAIERSHA